MLMSKVSKTKNRIGIVYFIYINSKKDYKKVIKDQLKDVVSSGVLNDADIYLEVNISDDVNCKGSLDQFFNSLGITFSNIHYTKENYFEYEGLSRIHTLAEENKYDFLCYFHTKGMSYKKKGLFNRSPREIVLTFLNFHNYKHTVKIFDSNKEIGKAGPFPCLNENTKVSDQWSWFNFFWARSDYVRNLEAPQKTTDRYYYESWISRASKTPSLCYSLYAKKIQGFTGSKASTTLKNLSKLYKYTFPISLIYIKLMYLFNK